jgi:hypothetical protein
MVDRRRDLTRHLNGRRRTNDSAKRNPQRHGTAGSPTTWGAKVDTTGFKTRDVHMMSLNDAKRYIVDDVRDARTDDVPGVLVCHGYQGGTVIREWVRNGSLEQALNAYNLNVRIMAVDQGNTAIRLV